MAATMVRVLLIEDDAEYAHVIQRTASAAAGFEIVTVASLAEAVRTIAHCAPDAVIADVHLPHGEGLETVARLRSALTRETSIVVLTDTDDPALARQVIEAGAQDVLLKNCADGDTIVRAVGCAIQRSAILGRLIESEAALRGSEARKTAVLESAFDAIVMMKASGVIVGMNAAAERMFGYPRSEAVGRELGSLIVPPERREQYRLALSLDDPAPAAQIIGGRTELDAIRADGARVPIELSLTRVDGTDGALLTAWVRDLTERRADEEALEHREIQVRQAQKMEAVGRLAGGVAHDFNNVLTAIFGYADLVLDSLDPHHPGRGDILEIKRAAERAANLTRQLLAFSRKQVLQPRRINLNRVVRNLQTLLDRLIGEDIELDIESDESLGEVRADPGQIEQVLMNLAANARDAMPEGGRLSIVAANADVSAEEARGLAGLAPGRFVRLTVTDTGHGIPEDVRRHIFEPFFTTKEQGKGTGLGLATVYGIVKQSGGWIYVASEPGHGTTFTIYLRRADATSSP